MKFNFSLNYFFLNNLYMGAAMLLSISFQYTFSDWSKQKVVAVQKCVISIDEETVNPHIYCQFGQGCIQSRADQKPQTWEDEVNIDLQQIHMSAMYKGWVYTKVDLFYCIKMFIILVLFFFYRKTKVWCLFFVRCHVEGFKRKVSKLERNSPKKLQHNELGSQSAAFRSSQINARKLCY